MDKVDNSHAALQNARRKWLGEHVGHNDYQVHWRLPEGGNYQYKEVTFIFNDLNRALLFKLTWGGVQ